MVHPALPEASILPSSPQFFPAGTAMIIGIRHARHADTTRAEGGWGYTRALAAFFPGCPGTPVARLTSALAPPVGGG
jgi:hypothetical protein